MTKVQQDVLDFGRHVLRAGGFTTTGLGPSQLGFGIPGCPAVAKGSQIIYCVKGSPLALHQVTPSGETRPVSGFSPAGFQDIFDTAKPTCDQTTRGTFYVEKGSPNRADKPVVCVKKSDNTYSWMRLSTP